MVISPTLPMGPEDRANKAAHRRQCRLPGHPQRQHLRLGMGQHCLEEPQEGRQLNSEGGPETSLPAEGPGEWCSQPKVSP